MEIDTRRRIAKSGGAHIANAHNKAFEEAIIKLTGEDDLSLIIDQDGKYASPDIEGLAKEINKYITDVIYGGRW